MERANLILIPKPGRDPESPSAYRPICLIDTMGKNYESMILQRLESEIERTGQLSIRQYGFRKGKSTIAAVEDVRNTIKRAGPNAWSALILLDIKNAFNSASWKYIIQKMRQRGIAQYLLEILKEYLRDRTLYVTREKCEKLSAGVPQGSVLGPTLWNVLFYDVLRVNLPDGVTLLAYADDLAVITSDEKEREMVRKGNATLDVIERWMKDHDLKLATEKTEALVIAGMKRTGRIRFRIGEHEPKKEVKYLGVMIDRHLNFGSHIQYACNKTEKVTAALGRLMPNVGGPSAGKRAVMAGVVHSSILYAAPIWVDGLRIQRHKQRLMSTERKVALRVASAYRTTSTEALLVIAGLIAMHLAAEERKRIYLEEAASKRRIREETLERWQREWETGVRGRWTFELIRDVGKWTPRKFGGLNYFITQFLTGHGSFRSYLRRIGKAIYDSCIYCGEVDTSRHALESCPRFDRERQKIRLGVGEVTALNIIDKALQSRESWRIIMGEIISILKVKEGDLWSADDFRDGVTPQ